MTFVRGLLALLILPVFFMLPTAAQANGRAGSVEHCVVGSGEELELIIMRDDPNNYSRIEKRLTPGECGVRVVDNCRRGWCPVRQGPFAGWVAAKSLAPVSDPVYCVARVDRGWTLDLRVAPSNRSRIALRLADTYCGITVMPVKIGHWTKVRAQGIEGWVSVSSVR